MTTLSERTAIFRRFGYRERQARFLVMAALHGGYFLRRQFQAFVGRGHGSVTVDFLRAVVSRDHAIASRLNTGMQIYHLIAKTLYAALGLPQCRNQRRHEISAIRRRVMALDFVLSRPAWTFLATERDAVTYFVDKHQIPLALLPSTQYPSAIGHRSRTNTHYFSEGYPIGVAPDGSTIALAYVDDADLTKAGFERFLRRYHLLCERVAAAVEFVFVTGIDGQSPLAERVFACTYQPAMASLPAAGAATLSDVLAYLRARQRVDEGALHGLQPHELDELRTCLQRFSGPVADEWYRRWHAGGDAAVHDGFKSARPSTQASSPRLTVHRLPFDYRAFGLWKPPRRC